MEKEKFEKKKKSLRAPTRRFSQLVEHGEAWWSAEMAHVHGVHDFLRIPVKQ